MFNKSQKGSFTCEFDPSSCPTNKELRQKFNKNSVNSPVVWQKGTTYGKLKFHGEDQSGLQVKVLKSDFVNVRKSNYYAFLAFGRTRCGKKFQQALINGDVTVDVMDKTHIYTVMDGQLIFYIIYRSTKRVKSGRSWVKVNGPWGKTGRSCIKLDARKD